MSDSTAVVPVLGTVVDLTQPAEVAQALADLRELKRQIESWRAEFEALLIEESTRQGSKTLHLGERTAKVTADTEIVWDLDILEEGLREAGLPEERYNQLVVATVTYKVSSAVAKQLEGANENYAKVIDRARTRFPGRTRVSIT